MNKNNEIRAEQIEQPDLTGATALGYAHMMTGGRFEQSYQLRDGRIVDHWVSFGWVDRWFDVTNPPTPVTSRLHQTGRVGLA